MKKARSISDQLSALQSPVSDEALVCDVLERLGPEYCPFTRALEARNTPASFDEVYAMLLSEETQLGLIPSLFNLLFRR